VFEARMPDGIAIDIDQFRLREDADGMVLRCARCEAEVSAVAWKPGVEYKRSSHFRLLPGTKHEDDCPAGKSDKGEGSGQTRPIKSPADFPGGYPSRLSIRSQQVLVGAENGFVVSSKDRYVHADAGSSQGGGGVRNGNMTSSLLQVCNFYLNHPECKPWPFSGDGLQGASYEDIFRSLHRLPREQRLAPRIYFGTMPFKMDFENSPESLVLVLQQKIGGGSARHYRVKICWKNWSENRRSRFLNLLEEKRAHLRERWLQEKRTSSSHRSCVYVFVIGQQAEDDLATFCVTDPRYLCILPWSYEVP